ncbi:MAG: HAD family hydrolase [Terriglobia bacterium]
MEIRALLFDVNGTLIDIETDEWMEEAYRAVSHYLTYQGIYMRRADARALYFQIMKEQLAASTEKYPEFDVVGVWREAISRCATDYTRALPDEKLRQMPLFIAEMQRGVCRKRLVAFPGMKEILAELKTRYRLAVVSDAQSAWGLPELRAAGLAEYFESIVISGDYGYRKPDRRLFQIALTALGVSAAEAVYIGNDRFRDVYGGRAAGMKTILFCPGGNTKGTAETEPEYILSSYAELPRALEFLAGV